VMPSQYPLHEICNALLAMFAGFKDHNGNIALVDIVSEKVLDEQDTLATKRLPAVMFMFAGANFIPKRDSTRITYDKESNFAALIGFRDLRAESKEQIGSLQFLELIADKLAGSRLTLASGARTEPIALADCELLEMGEDGTWYQLNFDVGALAQFSSK
jgi:phage gp37-like protein